MPLASGNPWAHHESITTINAASGGLDGATDDARASDDAWWPGAREIGIVLTGAFVYFGVRLVVEGDPVTATTNASHILRFEQRLGIDAERSLQDLVLDQPLLRTIGNLSYVWFHWPLLIVVSAVLFRRDHDRYLRLRRALMWSGSIGLLCFWLFPVAPPRFMPGFAGTVSDDARRHYLGYPLDWANQYASFPSFHVGWTLIACLALAATVRSFPARLLALVPASFVAFAVVTTGNHYVVDAVAGAGIAVIAYAVSGRRSPAPTEVCREGGLVETPRAGGRRRVGHPVDLGPDIGFVRR